jgi:hypothetical protein
MKLLRLLVFLVAATAANQAQALTVQCCTATSEDPIVLPSDVSATFDFDVLGTTLTLVVTNTDLSALGFNINAIYFNASGDVTSVTFDSATHSVAGDVTAAWSPLLENEMVDGFGVFDLGLDDGVGELNVNIIEPGEAVTFSFTVNAGLDPGDFVLENGSGWEIAAKFVNGPGDLSTFGAGDDDFPPAPEPALLGLVGLAVLGWAGRRRG